MNSADYKLERMKSEIIGHYFITMCLLFMIMLLLITFNALSIINLLISVITSLIYFLPTILYKGDEDKDIVFIANILFGITIVFWIVLLYKSYKSNLND